MKFLICAVGLIIESLIITLLDYTEFFEAPWVKAFWTVVLFAVYIFLARYLCKKWDQHVTKKSAKTEASNDEASNVERQTPEENTSPTAQDKPDAHFQRNIKTNCDNQRKRKMTTTKKIIIIASYILLIATVLSSLFYCNSIIKDKEGTINKLESDNSSLQSELNSKESALDTVRTNLINKESELEDTQAELETALANLQDQINSTLYWMESSTYWMNLFINSDPEDVTYSYSFNSVNELLTAVKDRPWAYNNMQVKVLGTLYNEYFDVCDPYLVDYENGESFPDNIISGELATYIWMKKKKDANQLIDIILASDTQFTVAESGDSVKMYGTVVISNGEIYLDNCKYSG